MRAWIRSSFRNRIFVTVLLITLVPLLLCDVLMMQLQLIRSENQMANQAKTELSALEDALGSTFSTCRDICIKLTDNTIVRSVLRNKSTDSRILYQRLFQDTDALRDYARFDIYDNTGKCLYTTGSSLPEGILPNSWGALGSAAKTETVSFRSTYDNDTDLLTCSAAVRTHDGQILGYVSAAMTNENFERLFNGLYSSPSDILLLDNYWHSIYQSQSGRIGSTAQALRSQLLLGEDLTGAGGENSYFAATEPSTGFTIILQQPKTFTSQVMQSIYGVSFLMGVLCLMLCLFSALLLSRHLSLPVQNLDHAMKEVEHGNYDTRLENNRDDELGRLSNSFNHMAREYRQNLERSVKRQQELNETQLRMLQAQLNPHFLYNTLDSMKWLGVTHRVPQVAELATDLAVLLRSGISGDEFITLEHELELLERYLEIQYIRFEDKFTCEIDIDEAFQQCRVPKLVLQPVVENAILHGISDIDDGYIKLFAQEENGDMLLHVSDNGRGMPPEMLERLNSGDMEAPEGHLGLFNVNSIIRLHYGSGYGVSAMLNPDGGSCVTIRLPIKKM